VRIFAGFWLYLKKPVARRSMPPQKRETTACHFVSKSVVFRLDAAGSAVAQQGEKQQHG
jgi:hypothetical protein